MSAQPAWRLGPPSRRAWLALGGAVLVGVVLLAASDALPPFVVGLLFAYIVAPLAERLAAAGLPRALAILLVYLVVLAVLGVGLALLIGPLIAQVGSFVSHLPDTILALEQRLDALVAGGGPAFLSGISRWLEQLRSALQTAGQGGTTGLPDLSGLVPLATGVAGPVRSLLAYLLVPVFAFWVLLDRRALVGGMTGALPPAWRGDAVAILGIVERVFGRWLRGQLVLCLAVGVASFVGLELLGLGIEEAFEGYAVLLAVIAGLFEFLPIIGPILSLVPAVVVAVAGGHLDAVVAVVILYTVIQQVENHVLVPVVQSGAVDLRPAVVIFVLAVGGALAGLLGAVLAIPITAAGREVYGYLVLRSEGAVPDEALRTTAARERAAARAAARIGGEPDATAGPSSAPGTPAFELEATRPAGDPAPGVSPASPSSGGRAASGRAR